MVGVYVKLYAYVHNKYTVCFEKTCFTYTLCVQLIDNQ